VRELHRVDGIRADQHDLHGAVPARFLNATLAVVPPTTSARRVCYLRWLRT
jgi:hypothetical protein